MPLPSSHTLNPTSQALPFPCRYVEECSRLDYADETRLHFTPQELKTYQEQLTSAPSASSQFSPHFICECYFMTAKALHMGYTMLFAYLTDYRRVSLHCAS